MSNKILTAAVAVALVIAPLSLASAQTTPAGSKKDAAASSTSESAGKASPAKAGSMMKSTKTTKAPEKTK